MSEATDKDTLTERINSLLKTHILDDNNNVVPVGFLEYFNWCETQGSRNQIGLTKLGNGVVVSTVFLGQPMLGGRCFETMVFNSGNPTGCCRRYSTYDEAVRGHEQIVRARRSGRRDV